MLVGIHVPRQARCMHFTQAFALLLNTPDIKLIKTEMSRAARAFIHKNIRTQHQHRI